MANKIYLFARPMERNSFSYPGIVEPQIRAFVGINPFFVVDLNPKDSEHRFRSSGHTAGRVLTEHWLKSSGSDEVICYSCSDLRIFRKTTDHVYLS